MPTDFVLEVLEWGRLPNRRGFAAICNVFRGSAE